MWLVEGNNVPSYPIKNMSLDSMEHRRDVAVMVFHKVLVQGVPLLAKLKLPTRTVKSSTRTVVSSDELVVVSRSHTSPHQGPLLVEIHACETSSRRTLSTQSIKLAAQMERDVP